MNNIPVKPKDAQWTDAQWNSIYAKGQDILVAAAAGSGKTAVLVERIIQKILRDEVDVDKLLVVTFTNLSAREMKHRVEQRIQQASLEDPKNEHLKSQRIKIHHAQISTLHSFCLKVIQQHYDVIQLDPNFRTISEVENVLLLEQSIDEVLEHHYEDPDIEFLNSIKTCRRIPITQAYLTTPEEGYFRIRKRGEGDKAVYIKTVKIKISDIKRIEIENYISKEQYDSYLAQRQYVTGVISKDRYCIVDNSTYCELDVYPFWNDRATIEIELLSEDQRYQLPKFVKLIREVSSEPDYRNLALAQKYGKP